MTPELQRFLELATRPLEKAPPLKDEAKGELMARVGHAGVPFEMLDLAEPLARLEAAPPEKPWRRRGALLAALVLSAGAVLGITAFLAYQITLSTMVSFLSYQRFARSSSPSFENPLLLQHVERNAPGLPLGRGILAGGDGMAETVQALSRQPDDPAMLQEHVCRQMLKAGKEWTGFDEDTRAGIVRLDADNALWPLLQAFALMESCTDPSAHYRSHGSSATPAIKDEAQFQNVLRLFSEAAAKPRYNDRSGALIRRQIEAFPPAKSFYDELFVQGYTGFVTRPFTGNFGFLGTRFAVMASVRCERLVTAKDQDGLRAFLGEWQNVVRLFLETPEPVERDTAMLLVELKTMGEILAQSCKDLGMAAEEAAAREAMARLPDQSYVYHPFPPELRKAAGIRLESYNNRGLEGLTVEEVLPSRKTELAFFDRHVAISLALVGLVFGGLVGLEACRRSKVVKGTARGLMPLFRKEDHLWIGGLGLAVPWLWWWVVTRLTPLGLHGADPEELDEGMIALMIQPAAAMAFAMVMLLQTARWRWEVRGGFLALGGFFPKLGWIAAGLTALAVPAAGMVAFLVLPGDEKAVYLLGVSCMGSFGLLWLLWEGIMNLFTPRASSLRPNLVMRVLLPWTFAGLFTLVAAYGVSTFMERRWFAKDPLLPSWTSKTHRNALQERRAEKWLDP